MIGHPSAGEFVAFGGGAVEPDVPVVVQHDARCLPFAQRFIGCADRCLRRLQGSDPAAGFVHRVVDGRFGAACLGLLAGTPGDIPDIGPTPPPWCEPDAQPAWDSLTHEGTTILSWSRDIGPDVWIAADDTIVDAELVRSAARIGFCEAPGTDYVVALHCGRSGRGRVRHRSPRAAARRDDALSRCGAVSGHPARHRTRPRALPLPTATRPFYRQRRWPGAIVAALIAAYQVSPYPSGGRLAGREKSPYPGGGVVSEAMEAEFDTVAEWTAQVAEELGPEYYVPAACRGSGSPAALDWLIDRMGLAPGQLLLDSGAGVGGPAAYAARSRSVQPVLVEPEAGACRAAKRLFDFPAVRGLGTALPMVDSSFDAAWSLGVLCTTPDQLTLLGELRRAVRSGGRIGLLAFVAHRAIPSDQLPENHFPTTGGLVELVRTACLEVEQWHRTTDLPAIPPTWNKREEAVTDALTDRYGHTRAWKLAQRQSARIGQLLENETLTGELLILRQA